MVQIRQARKKLARIGMLHGISQIFLSDMFLEKGSRMILNDDNKGILGAEGLIMVITKSINLKT